MKNKLEDVAILDPKSNPKDEAVQKKIKPLFPQKLRVVWSIPDLIEKDTRKKGQTTEKSNQPTKKPDSKEDTKFQVSPDRLFLKGYKLPKAISLEHNNIFKYGEKIVNEEIKKDWCKVARKIKYSPTLALERCHIDYGAIPDKLIIKFAKAFSNIISLDLARSVIHKKQVDKYVLFLLNFDKLKKLAYFGANDTHISVKLEDLKEFFQKICNTIVILNLSAFKIADSTRDLNMSQVYKELEESHPPLKRFEISISLILNNIRLNYSHQETKQKLTTRQLHNITCRSFEMLTQYEARNSDPPKSHPLRARIRSSTLSNLHNLLEVYKEDISRASSQTTSCKTHVEMEFEIFIIMLCYLKIIPSGEPISLKIMTTKYIQTDQPDVFSKLWGAIRKVPNLFSLGLSLPELSKKSISDLLETLVAIKTLKKIRISARNSPLEKPQKPATRLDDDVDLLRDTVMEKLVSFSNCLALDQDVDLYFISKKPLFTLEPIIKDTVEQRDNNLSGLSYAMLKQQSSINKTNFIFSSERLYSFNKKANELGTIQANDSKIFWPYQEQMILELCINYQTVKFSTLFVVGEEQKRTEILESIQGSMKSVKHEIELIENHGKLTGIITVSSNKLPGSYSFNSPYSYSKFIIL